MSALDRISVAGIGVTVADLEAEAKRAEAAGVECVWAPELFRAADTQAAFLAAKTERIAVGTGIAWAFTRSPFIHAISALDIDEMSGGRFRLEVGDRVADRGDGDAPEGAHAVAGARTFFATCSRCQRASPYIEALARPRLRKTCRSCSQVKPMPPWTWIEASGTRQPASEA